MTKPKYNIEFKNVITNLINTWIKEENNRVFVKLASEFRAFFRNRKNGNRKKDIQNHYRLLVRLRNDIDNQLNELNQSNADMSVLCEKFHSTIRKAYSSILAQSAKQLNDKELFEYFCYTEFYKIIDDVNVNLHENLDTTNDANPDSNANSLIKTNSSQYNAILCNEQLLSKFKIYLYMCIYTKEQNGFNNQVIKDYLMVHSNNEEAKENIQKMFIQLQIASFQDEISNVVKRERKNQSLTQGELSLISGVDRSMIAKIEKVQQRTSLETAISLLTSLKMGIFIYPIKWLDSSN